MMEHRCQSCGFTLFDNQPQSLVLCPKCGTKLAHYFDEDIRIEPDEYESDYDETSYDYEPEERS